MENGPVFLFTFAEGLFGQNPIRDLFLVSFQGISQFHLLCFNRAVGPGGAKGDKKGLGKDECKKAERRIESGLNNLFHMQHIIDRCQGQNDEADQKNTGSFTSMDPREDEHIETVHRSEQDEGVTDGKGVGEHPGRGKEHNARKSAGSKGYKDEKSL